MIICADDFGLSASVSWEILELIDRKKISATSCMMRDSHSSASAFIKLKAYSNEIDIGLHLALTWRDANRLSKEILEQILRFKEVLGFWPRHIDGHRHVQQLPRVKSILLAVAKKTISTPFYVRNGGLPLERLFRSKISLSSQLGAASIAVPAIIFRGQLEQEHIFTNTSLFGYYNFKSETFSQVFESYADLSSHPNDIFYVHPGQVDDELCAKDILTSERIEVSRFLKSERFTQVLQRRGLLLNRFQFEPDAHQ